MSQERLTEAATPGRRAVRRAAAKPAVGSPLLKALTFAMFMMFAMTTDSVGVIIPHIIRQYSLGMTAAGAFQYATMGGISLAALFLGFLADRLGRKATIIAGLLLFGGSCALFAVGSGFAVFVLLLFVGGVGIGIFKAGALALIGDLSRSTREHTATMNAVEGFFGVGAIIGPAIVTWLLRSGAGWHWLYVMAAGLCGLLVVGAAWARYPAPPPASASASRLKDTLALVRDPHALGFSTAAALYVGAEAAVYVWGPTYLAGYHGRVAVIAAYSVSIFFVLRAVGRFVGARVLARYRWTWVIAACTGGVFFCFLGAALGGRGAAAIALPASGVFMSVIYPTLNSKGISCFQKAQHGAAAGVLLFFTCLSAVLSPLAMAALSDAMGDARFSLYLATAMAAILAALALYNLAADPMRGRLAERDASDYDPPADARGLGLEA